MICAFSFTSASRFSATERRVSVRNPPCSPAFIMEATMGVNTCGCFPTAVPSVSPVSMSRRIVVRVCLNVGWVAWSLSTSRERDIGIPASFRVANCRTNCATIFGLTRLVPPNDMSLFSADFSFTSRGMYPLVMRYSDTILAFSALVLPSMNLPLGSRAS